MDIFGTIVNAIDLAERIGALIEGLRGAPEFLKATEHRVKRTGALLKECNRVFKQSKEYVVFHSFFQDAERTLSKVEHELEPYKKKSSEGGGVHLSLSKSLQLYVNRETLKGLELDLQHHELTLDLICG